MSSHGPVIQYCASLMAGTKRSVLHPLPETQLRHSADKEGLCGVSQLGTQLITARGLCCHLREGTDLCALPCHVWPRKPPELLSVKSERGFPVRNLQRLEKAFFCKRLCGGSCSQSRPRSSSQSAQPVLRKLWFSALRCRTRIKQMIHTFDVSFLCLFHLTEIQR